MANKLLSLSPFSGNVLQKYEKYRQETSFASLIKVKEASKGCVYQENVTFNKKERAPARAEALPKCCAIIFVFDLIRLLCFDDGDGVDHQIFTLNNNSTITFIDFSECIDIFLCDGNINIALRIKYLFCRIAN